MSDCSIEHRIIKEQIGNATSYKVIGKNKLFIPTRKDRDLKTTYKMVEDKITKFEKEYPIKRYGRSLFLQPNTTGTTLFVNPTIRLKAKIQFDDGGITYEQLVKEWEAEAAANVDPNRDALIDQDPDYLFYNLNGPDTKRKPKLPELERVLKRALKEITLVNGNERSKVKIYESMQKYNLAHKKKYGEEVSQEGIANIVDGWLAFGNNDGVTLAEESLHFLVEALWDTEVIKELRNTQGTNTRLIEETDVWSSNYEHYMEEYGNAESVEKEIIGKLLAQYMYDKTRVNRFTNKLLRLLEKFFKLLKINLSLTPNLSKYRAELAEILNKFDSNIKTNAYKDLEIDTTKYGKPTIIKNDKYKVKLKSIISNLNSRIELLGQVKNTLTNQMFTDFNSISNKYFSNNDVNKDQILASISQIESNTNLSQQDLNHLEDLYYLLNYIDKRNIETENRNRIKRLILRLRNIKEADRAKAFQEGINIFFFGIDGNIKDGDYSTTDISSQGLIFDLWEIDTTISKIKDNLQSIDAALYNTIATNYKLYNPLIKDLEAHYVNIGELDDLSVSQNARIKEALAVTSNYLKNMNNFLEVANTTVVNNTYNQDNYNPEVDTSVGDTTFTDISGLFNAVGQYQHVAEDWLKIFQKKIIDIKNNINRLTYSRNTSIYNSIEPYLKKVSYKQLQQIFEFNNDGSRSNYFVSDRHIGEYERAKKNVRETILKSTIAFSKNRDPNAYIPSTYTELLNWFSAVYDTTLPFNQQPKHIQHIWKVRDHFSKQWGVWHTNNSEEIEDVEKVIKAVEQTLPYLDYIEWLNNNRRSYVDSSGTTIVYYTGELLKPSAKYINNAYYNLSDDLKVIRDTLFNATTENKRRLALPNKQYEYFYRVPQVSKNAMDIYKDKLKGFGDFISDGIFTKVDDDFYANRIENDIIKKPPIRYESLVEDPKVLTNDIVRSVMIHNAMTENYMQYSANLNTLQGMVDIVENGKVRSNPLIRSSKIISGEKSELFKGMEFLLTKLVYGEANSKMDLLTVTVGEKELDFNKVINKLNSYVTKLNLGGNVTAMTVGLASGKLENIHNVIIGDYNTKEDYIEAANEVGMNTINILKDFESPVKTNKITVMASMLGLIDTGTSKYNNLKVNKLVRSTTAVLDGGGWRMADIALKYPLIVSVGKGIRKINDKWYTKKEWEEIGSAEDWNKGIRLWDYIDMKDNDIDWKDVPTKIQNIYSNRVSSITAMIDTVPNDYDKGMWQSHTLLKWFTMHQNWFYQLGAKSFKKRSYNHLTQRMEEGYFRTLGAMMFNPIKIVSFLKNKDFNNSLEREAAMRVLLMMSTTALLYLLSYVLVALAHDDDDEKDSTWLQVLTYIVMRMMMEQSSRISVADTLEYIKRPLAGIERAFGVFALIDVAVDLIFAEGETVERGFYKGYDQSTKALIKSTPIFKGLYENIYGGYVNDYFLGKKGYDDIGKAYYDKTIFMNNKGNLKGFAGIISEAPLSIYSKMLGGSIGRQIAKEVATNYENSSSININLPTKKASKDAKK